MCKQSSLVIPILFSLLIAGASTLACAAETAADEPARPDLHLGDLPAGRLLFWGNSITLHGPAPHIGWTGNWGMAASAEEKDFVHLLAAKVAKQANGEPQIRVRNIADFERQYADYNIAEQLKDDLTFEADVVIVAIGENVPGLADDQAKAAYAAAFARLLAELKQHGEPKIFVRSSFYPDAAKDEAMRKASADAGVKFIDISKLGGDPKNAASSERKFEHAGVASHPGDRGMQAIADAIWTAIEAAANAPQPASK